jgi:hypothetical protein
MAYAAELLPKSRESSQPTVTQPGLIESLNAIQEDSNDCVADTARRAYWDLIQNTTTLRFSGFANTLQKQDAAAREKCRAVAIQFLADGRTTKTSFPSSQALQQYLAPSADSDIHIHTESRQIRDPLRRMIILEDLPRNYVEVLGSQLKIHPAFFAAHWSDPIKNRHSSRGLTLNQSSKESFILRSPQMHRMEIETLVQDRMVKFQRFHKLDSHVQRRILKGAKESEEDLASCFGEMWNVVSFWSIKFCNRDWTGMNSL